MRREELIDQRFDEYKQYLSELIEIRSVISDDDEPFGDGINKALDKILEISNRMGFSTYRDPQGYYGYAEIGEGDLFGVLCHVDVVDEGNLDDWNYPPFELTEDQGKLFGRGSIDDKGPTISAMFALRLLLDEGFILNKRVRFIFGTDEESLWRCLDAYKAKEELPIMGFAPDADFPLVHVEKGMMQLIISGEGFGIEGGDSMNAVASHATIPMTDGVIGSLQAFDRRFDVIDERITVYGKSAHASTPEQGKNAIYFLAKAIEETQENTKIESFIVDLYENLPLKSFKDDESGPLTFNVGRAYTEQEKSVITLDVRYPVTFNKDVVLAKIKEITHQYGLSVTEHSSLEGLYIPEDHHLVQSLMESYKEVSGDKFSKPLKIGGATYARSMPNIVAFGPLFPGKEMTAHQANEYIEIEDLKKAIEIYMNAYEKLC